MNVTTDIRGGSAKEIILEICSEWPADMVLLGSHRLASLQRFARGSVSLAVTRTQFNISAGAKHMKVLVAIDDAVSAKVVCQFVSNHKWPDDTELMLTHAVDPASFDLNNIAFSDLVNITETEAESDAQKLLSSLAATISWSHPKVNCQTQIVRGEPADSIIQLTQSWSADLLIAGSHGRSGFKKILLGSVSMTLLAKAQCSVLLVKPDLVQDDESLKSKNKSTTPIIGRILIAMDETEVSDELITFVTQHIWSKAAQFKIISVVHYAHTIGVYPPPEIAGRLEAILDQRRAHMKIAVEKLQKALPNHSVISEIVEGDPKEEIAEFAKHWYASMVIIGHHNRKGWAKLFGSTSLATFCNAQCSVLMIRN